MTIYVVSITPPLHNYSPLHYYYTGLERENKDSFFLLIDSLGFLHRILKWSVHLSLHVCACTCEGPSQLPFPPFCSHDEVWILSLHDFSDQYSFVYQMVLIDGESPCSFCTLHINHYNMTIKSFQDRLSRKLGSCLS